MPDRKMVGLFWFIKPTILAVGVEITNADEYGDCLSFDGGHAELWDDWRSMDAASLRRSGVPLAVLSSEYDEHPRGRVIFDRRADVFMVYADRRLHAPVKIEALKRRFGLTGVVCRVRSDPHYR